MGLYCCDAVADWLRRVRFQSNPGIEPTAAKVAPLLVVESCMKLTLADWRTRLKSPRHRQQESAVTTGCWRTAQGGSQAEMGNPSHKQSHRAASGERCDHQGLRAQVCFMMKAVVEYAVNRNSRHPDHEDCP